MIVADDLGARTFAAVVLPEKPLVGELESVFEKRAWIRFDRTDFTFFAAKKKSTTFLRCDRRSLAPHPV